MSKGSNLKSGRGFTSKLHQSTNLVSTDSLLHQTKTYLLNFLINSANARMHLSQGAEINNRRGQTYKNAVPLQMSFYNSEIAIKKKGQTSCERLWERLMICIFFSPQASSIVPYRVTCHFRLHNNMFSFSFHSSSKKKSQHCERQRVSLSSDNRTRWIEDVTGQCPRECSVNEMRKLILMTVAISSVYVSLPM